MPKLFDIKCPGGCNAGPEGFWAAVDVWIKKPHVANKRLCGVKETDGKDVDREDLHFLLKDPESELSQDVFSFLQCGISPAHTHGKDKPWPSTVRRLIPKANCYGKTLHKDLVLKGKNWTLIKGSTRISFLLWHFYLFLCLLQTLTDSKWPSFRMKRIQKEQCL